MTEMGIPAVKIAHKEYSRKFRSRRCSNRPPGIHIDIASVRNNDECRASCLYVSRNIVRKTKKIGGADQADPRTPLPNWRNCCYNRSSLPHSSVAKTKDRAVARNSIELPVYS